MDRPERRGSVLVIDDEAMLRRTLRRVLAEHELVEVGDGREALELLAKGGRFDVVLCDVVMPRVGGIEFWRTVAERHPELLDRIVFMTGGTLNVDDERFLASGLAPVLGKPFHIDVLREIVARRIARAPRRDQTTV